MKLRFIIALVVGTLAMAAVMLICRKWYSVSRIRIWISSALLTVSGLMGVCLMYFIENGKFGGLSFYGGVFFVPLFMIPVSRLVSVPARDLIDLSAPSVSTMLAVMKVECLRTGCCGGKVLYVTETGSLVRFPSQAAELASGLVIAAALILLMRSEKNRGKIYPYFMLIYGVVRFVLNWFRDTEAFLLGLPAGNFWSIISVLIGIAWIVLHRRRESNAEKKDICQ